MALRVSSLNWSYHAMDVEQKFFVPQDVVMSNVPRFVDTLLNSGY